MPTYQTLFGYRKHWLNTPMHKKWNAVVQYEKLHPTHGWKGIVENARAYQSDLQKLEVVNRLVNMYPYRADDHRNRWKTPPEFLEEGGDCEDFCIAKYFALKNLGFGKKLEIVACSTQDGFPASHGYHAILVCWEPAMPGSGKAMIMDNMRHGVRYEADYKYGGDFILRPVVGLTENAWFRYRKN